jgi:hypothetical protein
VLQENSSDSLSWRDPVPENEILVRLRFPAIAFCVWTDACGGATSKETDKLIPCFSLIIICLVILFPALIGVCSYQLHSEKRISLSISLLARIYATEISDLRTTRATKKTGASGILAFQGGKRIR